MREEECQQVEGRMQTRVDWQLVYSQRAAGCRMQNAGLNPRVSRVNSQAPPKRRTCAAHGTMMTVRLLIVTPRLEGRVAAG